MEEGVRLALEAGRRSEEDNNQRLNFEEEERLVEEARLKYEEEDLRLKAEYEARLVEEARLKDEQEHQASL